MAEIKFETTKEEDVLISRITQRAKVLLKIKDVGSLQMDLSATHCNCTPIDFEKLLAFDDFNFSHDIYGIMDTIDRTNGQLTHGFLPRCSKH